MALLLGRWLRKYLAGLALVGILGGSFIGVVLFGTGPMPQQPPEGYELDRGTVSLQWNKGTRKGEITLQVSVDDPSFSTPILDKKVTGTTHSLTKLERGKKYYWRLLLNNKPGPTASFKVYKYNVKL